MLFRERPGDGPPSSRIMRTAHRWLLTRLAPIADRLPPSSPLHSVHMGLRRHVAASSDSSVADKPADTEAQQSASAADAGGGAGASSGGGSSSDFGSRLRAATSQGMDIAKRLQHETQGPHLAAELKRAMLGTDTRRKIEVRCVLPSCFAVVWAQGAIGA